LQQETSLYLLDIEPLDLGPDVRAVGLELVEDNQQREPVRGAEAATVWARVLPVLAGSEPWALDFFSHVDRVRDFCRGHDIAFRDATPKSIVIPAPKPSDLESLFDRFLGETFGARAGGVAPPSGDSQLEGELARKGVDAYHAAFRNYYFCAVCDFENGSLTVLSQKLWASETIRRLRPVLKFLEGVEVEIRLPA
jgi:hypothetical protein